MDQGSKTTFSENVVTSLKNNYCGYRQKYVIMAPRYVKTTKHYFTEEVIRSHLAGQYALGVFAGEHSTKFMCFDVDAGGKKAVRRIIDALVEIGMPRDRVYVSTSGCKGYHVDLFFDPFIYNEKAKNLYDLVIWRTGLDPKKVEFRPTHGQAVKLPLGIHAKTGNRCWYLDPVSLAPICDPEYVTTIQPISSELLCECLKKWNKKHWNELYVEMMCGDPTFVDSDQKSSANLHIFNRHANLRLTEPSTRHDVMIEIAKDLRHTGAKAPKIMAYLLAWYKRQDPSLITSTEDEVRDDAESISEWVEENVPVLRTVEYDPSQRSSIAFTKDDIQYVLRGPTSAARKAALLLWTYCKLYGYAKISYARIAETIGCSEATAKSAVTSLIAKRVVNRQSGGLHIVNGKMMRKSNVYTIPKKRKVATGGHFIADEYVYAEAYDKNKFDHFYYTVLGGLCADEYLAEFLTKPELAEVRKAREQVEPVSGDGNSDA